jgi:TusA-related sulfurtransferase
MFFKKIKAIKELKARNEACLETIKDLRNKIFEVNKEILDVKVENKKIKEDFTKNYHYVLTVDKNEEHVHLYQDGKEIKWLMSVKFESNIDSVPTFNIEVR